MTEINYAAAFEALPRRRVASPDLIERTADEIRLRLSHPTLPRQPDAVRNYWRGALAALEHVMGEPPTMDDGEAAALLARLNRSETGEPACRDDQ